jgi:hypothetical protein
VEKTPGNISVNNQLAVSDARTSFPWDFANSKEGRLYIGWYKSSGQALVTKAESVGYCIMGARSRLRADQTVVELELGRSTPFLG